MSGVAGGLSSTDAAIVGGVLGPILLMSIAAIIVVIIIVIFVMKVRLAMITVFQQIVYIQCRRSRDQDQPQFNQQQFNLMEDPM